MDMAAIGAVQAVGLGLEAPFLQDRGPCRRAGHRRVLHYGHRLRKHITHVPKMVQQDQEKETSLARQARVFGGEAARHAAQIHQIVGLLPFEEINAIQTRQRTAAAEVRLEMSEYKKESQSRDSGRHV